MIKELTYVCVLPALWIWASSANFHTKQFQNNAAVYIEDINAIGLITGTLRIAQNISTEDAEKDKQLISRMHRSLQHLCTATTNNSSNCQSLADKNEKVTTAIINTINTAMTKHHRSRRHTLFYDTLHYVFGLDNDAYQEINDLQDDHERLRQALIGQNQKLVLIHKSMANHTKELEKEVIKHLTLASSEITSISSQQQFLYSLEIIKSLQKEIADKYTSILQPSPTIDLPNFKALDISVSKTQRRTAKWTGNTLSIFTDHPIFSTAVFQGYKISYLPQKTKAGSWHKIKHFAHVIALRGDNYTLLSSENWRECIQEEVDLHICRSPGISNAKKHPSCLLQYFYKEPQPMACPTTTVEMSTLTFKATATANTWLYATEEPAAVTVTCTNSTTNTTLQGIGYIHIDPQCHIGSDSKIITAVNFNTIGVKKAHLAYSDPPESARSKTLEMAPIPDTEQFSNAEMPPEEIRHHLRRLAHTNVGLSLSTLIVLGAALYLLYRCCMRPKLRLFDIPK